jgi:hypothetical protein
VDVGTGLALLGSVKLLEKMLGPTAEYIGDGLQTWAKKRTENVRRIFSFAEKNSETGSKQKEQCRQKS